MAQPLTPNKSLTTAASLIPTLFQQPFHVIVDHPQFLPQLHPRPAQPAPTPLLGSGNKTLFQISRTPPVRQPLRVAEIRLPFARRSGL
jgi:hypothetical protein